MNESTQSLVNVQALPNPRRRNILDFPNELLIRTFDYVEDVEGDREEKDLCHFNHLPGDVCAIRTIRLTCRRFYQAISHRLIRHIRVELSYQSLARLDEISRHLFVSKGVRVISLSLGPLYDQDLAPDIQTFVAFRAEALRRSIQYWGSMAYGFFGTPQYDIEVYRKAQEKAIPFVQSWEKLANHGIDVSQADHVLIQRAHTNYLQLLEDQKNICSSFSQTIASAIARMPSATRVRIDNTSSNRFREGLEHLNPGCFDVKDLDETESLLRALVSPVQCPDVRDHEPGPSSFHLVVDLLLSIRQLKTPLLELDITTPPPAVRSLIMDTYEPTMIHAAVKQLKTIKFHPYKGNHEQYWYQRTPDKWFNFTTLLRCLLHTETLQNIELDFIFMVVPHPPLLSMAPILLSHTWPNLKKLQFTGPFHFAELKAVVKSLGRDVDLQWSGHLMSGSWADVLDLLRERDTPTQKLGNLPMVYGQECDRMTLDENLFIFNSYTMIGPLGIANLYIRGQLPSNPVRDWDRGELDIPESIEAWRSG